MSRPVSGRVGTRREMRMTQLKVGALRRISRDDRVYQQGNREVNCTERPAQNRLLSKLSSNMQDQVCRQCNRARFMQSTLRDGRMVPGDVSTNIQ